MHRSAGIRSTEITAPRIGTGHRHVPGIDVVSQSSENDQSAWMRQRSQSSQRLHRNDGSAMLRGWSLVVIALAAWLTRMS
jgi:hypothetical protein